MKQFATHIRSKIIAGVFALGLLVGVGLAVQLPALVHADAKTAACEAINAGAGCEPQDGLAVENVVKTGIDFLSIAVGVVAVVMIILAGFKFVTASGDSNKVTSARNTIMYALIGIVVVALAQVIVKFTVDTATTCPYDKTISIDAAGCVAPDS